ncbi:reverse transcriptase zinc-binding domain-containing protein [Artemisia annua]|uniref:Reverse transcriptase zinc-binding domain-containing protein n=1 Tax=Artemisia annua TaxID=35608 RepID=A0A2U1PV96_ARTAN|nr:reverse transcriptase zinc-binding domain-containing protein [Artemisia annua]
MANVSWGWRKLLQIRDLIRPHIWVKLGNGAKVLAWFDTWYINCPLSTHLPNRLLFNAGYTRKEYVKDIMLHGSWTWPTSWNHVVPVLSNITVPHLDDNQIDSYCWRMHDGSFTMYSVNHAWQCVRQHGIEVDWFHIV